MSYTYLAVHCSDFDEAAKVLDHFESLGYEWPFGASASEFNPITEVSNCLTTVCGSGSRGMVQYADFHYCKAMNYPIISGVDYLKNIN